MFGLHWITLPFPDVLSCPIPFRSLGDVMIQGGAKIWSPETPDVLGSRMHSKVLCGERGGQENEEGPLLDNGSIRKEVKI